MIVANFPQRILTLYEKNDPNRHVTNTESARNIDEILAEIDNSIRNEAGRNAYELSLQVTQAAPHNIEAWLLRATLAPSLEERIVCVNHLNELGVDHQDRHNVAFFALKELLDRDPFLAYLEETDDLYRVINGDHMVISILKKRSPITSPSQERSNPLASAHRWLMLAIIGLTLAGVGTLLFAPLAALAAIPTGLSPRSRSERISSTIVFILAIALFLIGVVFSFLFVLHFIG